MNWSTAAASPRNRASTVVRRSLMFSSGGLGEYKEEGGVDESVARSVGEGSHNARLESPEGGDSRSLDNVLLPCRGN